MKKEMFSYEDKSYEPFVSYENNFVHMKTVVVHMKTNIFFHMTKATRQRFSFEPHMRLVKFGIQNGYLCSFHDFGVLEAPNLGIYNFFRGPVSGLPEARNFRICSSYRCPAFGFPEARDFRICSFF